MCKFLKVPTYHHTSDSRHTTKKGKSATKKTTLSLSRLSDDVNDDDEEEEEDKEEDKQEDEDE